MFKHTVTYWIYNKFQSISLYGQPFSSNSPFQDNCTKWLQNGIEHYNVKFTCIVCLFYYYHRVPNFTPFRCRTKRFQVRGHFVTRSSYDPRMTLNTTRPNVTIYLCDTTSSVCKISIHSLYDQPFRVTDHLNKCIKWSASWPWQLQCQRYVIYVQLVPLEPQMSIRSPIH